MAHPDIAEAAVVAIPDERWQERPLALVVLNEGAEPDFSAYRAFLRGHLAGWQVPEHWAVLASLLKTTVGKVEKRALRARHARGNIAFTTLP
ncbi:MULTISPECIES: AMP-binding enzyme [unclassified Streptomyces]|uniref:AMP-binding enzyme n=1 Tax=unclassified Streptomyces TaxID=2593676 RepID=UPI003D8D4414